ncbi:MAG: ABC transporter permease subunit [Propionibacteriales bacterium]|nr:ABC transporter permease subunit [Propionibacteriales bacterium]
MGRVVVRRLAAGVLTLLVVSGVVFAAGLLLPGDAARAVLGRTATPERLEALRQQMHLDDPPLGRYWSWIGDLATGNLGDSVITQQPVTQLIGERATNSVLLMVLAALVATPLSILLGTWSALRRDRLADHATSLGTLVLASLPEFVTGVVLLFLFSTVVFRWFPAVTDATRPVLEQPAVLVLPTVTLVLAVSPYITRMMRATMLEVLDSEYVHQARLKGVPERTVLLRHALPNSIGPVAQVVALQLAWLAGGIVLVETLFAYPGIGEGIFQAVDNRDIPTLQALVMLVAAFYVVVNLLADVIGVLANPRLRAGAR